MTEKRRVYAGTVVAALVAVLMASSGLEGRAAEHDLAPRKTGAHVEHFQWWNPFAGIVAVWHSFDEKLEQVAHVDQENERLRKQVAELELENAELRDKLGVTNEKIRAEALKLEAKAEGGVETSRTLASLHADKRVLEAPPKKRFTEALEAITHGDYETSGRALASLVDGEDDAYHSAQAYYLAGVSLYKVGNFRKALSYFTRAEEAAIGADLAYAPRALAWKALCFHALGRAKDEAATVKQVIQKYPKSQEARRLNRNA